MAAPKKWTAERIELLRRLYPTNLTGDLVDIFGGSPESITRAAFRFGIRKDPAIRAMNGRSGQFRKGHVPMNKGRKMTEWASEEGRRKIAETQFKTGNIPSNVRPMYSERITKDGYVYIKVPGHGKFVLKHRWIWEKHLGPIPKGCQIHFMDGDRTNCDISNLELITTSENARRNSLWSRYPKEIACLCQLKGALNKQIRKKSKSNQ